MAKSHKNDTQADRNKRIEQTARDMAIQHLAAKKKEIDQKVMDKKPLTKSEKELKPILDKVWEDRKREVPQPLP
jgi:hypothetical protein